MNKKGKVNGKICDIITVEEYYKNPSLYNDGFTAIQKDDMLYPIRRNNMKAGFYQKNQVMGIFIKPNQEDEELYKANDIIDFSSTKDMKDMIEKRAAFKDLEREILCDPDNIFRPVVKTNDSPEMRALKEAVTEKTIDINKYEQRFGSTFSNDRRLFNNESITLSKLRTMCDALDIKVSLTLEDKNSEVPNPIGRVIHVDLSGSEDIDE